MDQSLAVPVIAPEVETIRGSVRNDFARAASIFGIIGLVSMAGVLALAANAMITVFTTPHFMVYDIGDHPFLGICVACLVPLSFGFIGLIFGIVALRSVPKRGKRAPAIW